MLYCQTHSQIETYKKYGVTRSTVSYLARNYFSPPSSYLDCFEKFYLLYWTGDYFKRSLIDGKITREGVTYLVIYRKPCIRIYNSSQIRCSFRQPKAEFNLPAYVIVDLA